MYVFLFKTGIAGTMSEDLNQIYCGRSMDMNLNVSKGLCILSDNYTQYPEPPGYVGDGGTHLWIIKAVTQGNQQVKGIYKQSWMETTGTEENFTLHVEVI